MDNKRIQEDKLYDKVCEFIDLFHYLCDESDLSFVYDLKDKYGDETYKYNFDKNKLEATKEDLKDNPDKIVVDKAGYNDLIEKINSLHKENKDLKSKNEALVDSCKKVSDNGHKIVDSNSKLQRIINDKLYADGYKIMNDIKVYIEFARKCDAFKNSAFVDMIDLIAKTINDFIASQKKPVIC